MEGVELWVLRGLAAVIVSLVSLADASFSLGNWRKRLSSCLGAVPACGLLDLRGK